LIGEPITATVPGGCSTRPVSPLRSIHPNTT
jgi:hypothetical protein